MSCSWLPFTLALFCPPPAPREDAVKGVPRSAGVSLRSWITLLSLGDVRVHVRKLSQPLLSALKVIQQHRRDSLKWLLEVSVSKFGSMKVFFRSFQKEGICAIEAPSFPSWACDSARPPKARRHRSVNYVTRFFPRKAWMQQKMTLQTIVSVWSLFNQTNVTLSLPGIWGHCRWGVSCPAASACRQLCLHQSLWAPFVISEEKQEFPWCKSSDLF